MRNEIEINLEPFDRGLRRWAEGVGKDMPEAIHEQTILLLRQLLKLLPPKNLAQGRKRLAGDLRRAALPIFGPDHPSTSETVAEMVEAGDTEAIQQLIQRAGIFPGFEVVPFDESLHTSVRRKGSVESSQKKAVIDHAAWLRYFREVSKRIGTAKGSLAGTLMRLGQSVPAWMARHANSGTTSDRTRDRRKPYLRITSYAYHLHDLGIDKKLTAAERIRTKAMKLHLDRVLRARAKQAGFRTRG